MSDTSTTTDNQGQLGTIVSWRVPSSVSLAALRDGLTAAGLDPDLAADMLPRNALKRALREMKEGRVIRQLRLEGDLLYFQFTREYLDEREITYSKEAELTLDLETGAIDCDVPELALRADSLMQEHMGKRLTSDLTRLVQRIYDANRADLVPIREQGGAYFVPDMHRSIVDGTRTLLNSIGGKLRSFDVRLGSGDTSASVADSMSEYLTDLIEQFRQSCDSLSQDTRSNVRENREAAIAELRRKLECYGGLLGGYADAIQAEIASGEQQMLEALLRESAPAELPEEQPAVA